MGNVLTRVVKYEKMEKAITDLELRLAVLGEEKIFKL